MPLSIIVGDITKMRVDAIVNATNNGLFMRFGVCGAIFRAAGAEKLHAACDKLAPIQTGEAVMTPGFDLSAKYIIHIVGPVYRDGKYGEKDLLRSCYTNALNLARKNSCESVAFPLISSGIYGYPKDEALIVATKAIGDWLLKDDTNENGTNISLVVFERSSFALSQKLHEEVKAFIDENYAGIEHGVFRRRLLDAEDIVEKEALATKPTVGGRASVQAQKDSLDDIVGSLDEPFSVTLFRLIDGKGKTDAEIYRRANIDRKLFSKIRTDKNYKPKKETIVALAVALELTLKETSDLLKCAGLTFSHSLIFDVILEYFITHGKYDIWEINNVLYKYDQLLLGGKSRN